jgi:hypothetical protein
MKARLVHDIRAPGGQPGDIEFRAPNGEPMGFAYRCPGCGAQDWLDVGPLFSGWTWDGNADAPTLRPSILHRPCNWHGYLTAGEFAPC